jgi:hypothetical protein
MLQFHSVSVSFYSDCSYLEMLNLILALHFSKFNVCTLNIRSLTKPTHYTALADLAAPIMLISLPH